MAILAPIFVAMTDTTHQLSGNDLDVMCRCGWYNHDPDEAVDKSATAHVLREVAHQPDVADRYERAYREQFR